MELSKSTLFSWLPIISLIPSFIDSSPVHVNIDLSLISFSGHIWKIQRVRFWVGTQLLALHPSLLLPQCLSLRLLTREIRYFISTPSNKSWGQRVWVQGYSGCTIMAQSEVGNTALLMWHSITFIRWHAISDSPNSQLLSTVISAHLHTTLLRIYTQLFHDKNNFHVPGPSAQHY